MPPPVVDGIGLGPRVPLLVISPWAKPGYIGDNQGEFASFDDGYNPSDPLDQAIMATRKAVFSLHGLMP